MAYAAAYFSNSGGHVNITVIVTLSSLARAEEQPDADGVECEAEVGFLVCPCVQSEVAR